MNEKVDASIRAVELVKLSPDTNREPEALRDALIAEDYSLLEAQMGMMNAVQAGDLELDLDLKFRMPTIH